LLGGPGSRPAAVDALVARTLVKGEPLTAPAGRADDPVWPRREVGIEPSKADTPVATAAPETGNPAAPPKPKKPRPVHPAEQAQSNGSFGFRPASPQPAPKQRPAASRPADDIGNFFSGLFGR
jgi:hypothetical protein